MQNNGFSRRGFLKQAALGGAALSAGRLAMSAGKFKNELGFQLYTLRKLFASNPESAFKRLSEGGYSQVEVLRAGLDPMVPMFKNAGLKMVSGHFDTALITGGPGAALLPKGYDWQAAIAQAKNIGLRYMVIPYIAPNERGDLDLYKRLADQFNKAGESCKGAGLSLCYHNHAFEFEPLGSQRPIDILLERCEKNLIGFEIDIFWVSVAGIEPAGFLRSLTGRVPLIHLKDKEKGTENAYSEAKVRPSAFKEVGSGILNIPAILDAAAAAGVKEYFVEQDQCPGDPVDSLLQSCKYLRSL